MKQQKLIIEAGRLNPYVSLDAETGILIISGISDLYNEIEFYQPVKDWLVKYMQDLERRTVLILALEYCPPGQWKQIYQITKSLNKVDQQSSELHILWFYEEDNEDYEELGQETQNFAPSASFYICDIEDFDMIPLDVLQAIARDIISMVRISSSKIREIIDKQT
ncbi:MAG: DUF1987 domain-containing protein [bacterium]|nr:DUF1987 domain-containing protein [bacterium]